MSAAATTDAAVFASNTDDALASTTPFSTYVSVVMPVYNAAAFVESAIESILHQSYPHFELIVVDDGSTDETLRIVDACAARDARIRVLPMRKNGGVSRATNAGLQAARYDWVAIMHADDLALPRRLEKQMRAAREHPEVVAWGSFGYHINSAGDVLSVSETGPTSVAAFDALRAAGEPAFVIHSSVLVKRAAVLAAGGYDPGFHTCEDLDLFDRLAEQGPIVALPEPLVARRLHPHSNTVRTFFTMLDLTRYVLARRRAWRDGAGRFDLADYRRARADAPLFRRLRERLDDLCQYHYHEAGVRFGERQAVRAVAHFASACALNPAYALPRVWNQLFAFRLRQARTRQATAAASATAVHQVARPVPARKAPAQEIPA